MNIIDTLPSTGNLSMQLLKEQAAKNKPDAIRELGRYILKYADTTEQLAKGRLMLLAAACMADRGASWLLAHYFKSGKYGFNKSSDLSEQWRLRTEGRLRSDAELIYDNQALKDQAVRRYSIWKSQWS